ncbi:uncharacterized protein MONOS_18562 [Monocercomonoides exilis]|uniref:uncharacterized protein n=1 Tax=Monocercomonoides exilis TaxID=2049356 RepID=UPI00355A556B|nr:hypothetical protein MONOS_18562 [Monocercomonoides exilis]
MLSVNNTFAKIQTAITVEKYTELFSELEHCNEDEQAHKIEKMIEMNNEMKEGNIITIFTTELFNQMDKMIEKRKLSLDNLLLLLKRVWSCKGLKHIWGQRFACSSLCKRFEKLIVDEEKKNEDKNEKHFIDLFECYISLNNCFPTELQTICMHFLLEIASNKGESEEIKKKVETALLTLSHIDEYYKIGQELYLNEIKDIIQYHQEHRNLSQLAYQSAWQFLIGRLFLDKNLRDTIANELSFVKEATKELNELAKSVNNKRKEEDKGEKEVKEVQIIRNWIYAINHFVLDYPFFDEKSVGMFCSLVGLCNAARENERELFRDCISLFETAAYNEYSSIEVFSKSGVFDLCLDEIQQPTMEDKIIWSCLRFFLGVLGRLERKSFWEFCLMGINETKRKIAAKMEEDGYEDTITSFHEIFDFLNSKKIRYFFALSSDISDYFVNV